MKFSGGVLGKFAGFVNDKNKGWYDRSKNWSKDRREIIKNKKLANPNMARFNPNRLRRWADHKGRLLKKDLETSQKNAENSFRDTAMYKKSDLDARQASRRSDLLSAQDDNRYLEATLGHAPTDTYGKYDRALRAKSTKYSNWRDAQQAQFMSDIKDLETEIAVSGLIKNNAQRQQHSEFAEQLINSKELREKAGGHVFKDANGNLIGANAALASAIATSRSEYAKSIDEARQIIKHYKLDAKQRQGLALDKVSISLPGGVNLSGDSIFVREAAIEEQIKYGTATEVAELLSELPPEFYSSAASALAESGVRNKASFMGGKLIDDMLKGDINNRGDLMNHFAEWLEGGKYKPETLASTDADAVKLLIEAVNTTSVITDKKRQDLKKVINTINISSMSVYKVPQDVEAEDKLLGPFSFRQFVFLIIAVAGIGIAYALSQLLLPLFLIPMPVVLFFGALALPLKKDQPMEVYLAAVISFMLKPKKRLWQPDGIETLVEVIAPKTEEKIYGNKYDQAEVQRRLSYLANLVDSQGWSIRGVNNPNSSMQADLFNEGRAANDILDENSTTAQNINNLMRQSDIRRREEVIQKMQTAQTTTVATSQLTNSTPTAQLIVNPYPTMRQSTINPLSDNKPTNSQPTATPQTSLNDVSPAIIDLANNHSDLSVETISREANRIQQENKLAEEEVVISLR